jgi:hypothetical protein
VRRGIDINAGCGQLKNELLAKEILEGGGLASAGVRTTLGKVVVMENKGPAPTRKGEEEEGKEEGKARIKKSIA